MSNGEYSDSGAQARPARKLKRGDYLVEREPSARKVNVEREARINFSAQLNLLFAVLLLCNAAYAVVKIVRSDPPSSVYIQSYTNSGLMTAVQTVSFSQLPPIRAKVTAGETIIAAEPSQAPQALIDIPGQAPASAQQPAPLSQPTQLTQSTEAPPSIAVPAPVQNAPSQAAGQPAN